MNNLLFILNEENKIEFKKVINENPNIFGSCLIDFAKDYGDGIIKSVSGKYKIIIVDLYFDNNKGIELLKYLETNCENIKRPQFVYVIIEETNSLMLDILKGLSIDCIIKKPINYRFLSVSIKASILENSKETIKSDEFFINEMTVKILNDLGVPTNLNGYYYLKEGIRLCCHNQTLVKNITTELYPLIAKNCNSVEARVERGIRHAIHLTSINGNKEIMEELFGYMRVNNKKKPTNSQFISSIVENILYNIRRLRSKKAINLIDDTNDSLNGYVLAEDFGINYLGRKR